MKNICIAAYFVLITALWVVLYLVSKSVLRSDEYKNDARAKFFWPMVWLKLWKKEIHNKKSLWMILSLPLFTLVVFFVVIIIFFGYKICV
jgi:hypothetical protein